MNDKLAIEVLEILFDSWNKNIRKELFNSLSMNLNEIQDLVNRWNLLPKEDKLSKKTDLKDRIEGLIDKIHRTEDEITKIWGSKFTEERITYDKR